MRWISSWLFDLIIQNSYLNNYKKTVILITIKKAFLSSIFLLIFSLVRTAFLSWHTKFEKRKAFKKS